MDYTREICSTCGEDYAYLHKHLRYHPICKRAILRSRRFLRNQQQQQLIHPTISANSPLHTHSSKASEPDTQSLPASDSDTIPTSDTVLDDVERLRNDMQEVVRHYCGLSSVTEFEVACLVKRTDMTMGHANSLIALMKAQAPDNMEVQAIPNIEKINKKLTRELELDKDLSTGSVCLRELIVKVPEDAPPVFHDNGITQLVVPYQDPTTFILKTLVQLVDYEDLMLVSDDTHGLRDDLNSGDRMRKLVNSARRKHGDSLLQVIGLVFHYDGVERGAVGQGRVRNAHPMSFTVSVLPRNIRDSLSGKSFFAFFPERVKDLKVTEDEKR